MEYNLDELNDPEREVIRPKSKRRHEPFEFCKWAAGEWEARFFAGTKSHRVECDAHIRQLTTDPAWFKTRPKKVARSSNNKAMP